IELYGERMQPLSEPRLYPSYLFRADDGRVWFVDGGAEEDNGPWDVAGVVDELLATDIVEDMPHDLSPQISVWLEDRGSDEWEMILAQKAVNPEQIFKFEARQVMVDGKLIVALRFADKWPEGNAVLCISDSMATATAMYAAASRRGGTPETFKVLTSEINI